MLGHGHRLRFVRDRDVDDAVGALHRRSGPISSGRKTPSPPPSIMAGPPMPMLASGRGDDHVAAAEQRRRCRQSSGPRRSPTMRHEARQLAEVVERVEADEAAVVVVAGPAAAAFGEQHERQRPCSATSIMRSVFQWLCTPWVPANTV